MPHPGVDELRLLGLLAGLLFFVLVGAEWLFPLRQRRRPFWPRFVVNLLLSIPAYIVAATVVRPAALALAGWNPSGAWGLLALFPTTPPVQVAMGFLLMDVSFYYWHRLNHRIPFLWRFHNVHHIDPDLDITTAVRFHFGEIFLSAAFRALQVSIIGVGAPIYFLYEVVFQANTLFHHSNVRLPISVERILNKVLVTPRMHGIHHSTVKQETNSDYSSVFPWWDWMHGTLRLNVPQSNIRIGVPAYLDPGENTFWNCLRMPFVRQRDYWRYADGTCPAREPHQTEGKQRRLAG